MADGAAERPLFFFDLSSPYCWLVAERIGTAVPDAIWQPVLAADLSDGLTWDQEREFVERVAQQFELPLLKWPKDDQSDARNAMLAACFAKSIGRGVAYSMAAMRQAFNGGRSLEDTDTILIAAAACEMHPRAVLKALDSSLSQKALAAAAELARERGVVNLPALSRVGELLDGDALIAHVASDLVSIDR